MLKKCPYLQQDLAIECCLISGWGVIPWKLEVQPAQPKLRRLVLSFPNSVALLQVERNVNNMHHQQQAKKSSLFEIQLAVFMGKIKKKVIIKLSIYGKVNNLTSVSALSSFCETRMVHVIPGLGDVI